MSRTKNERALALVKAELLVIACLVEAILTRDTEMWADCVEQAGRMSMSGPILRSTYDVLNEVDAADVMAIDHLMLAGMTYTDEEAIRWIEMFGPLAQTVRETDHVPGPELKALIERYGPYNVQDWLDIRFW